MGYPIYFPPFWRHLQILENFAFSSGNIIILKYDYELGKIRKRELSPKLFEIDMMYKVEISSGL